MTRWLPVAAAVGCAVLLVYGAGPDRRSEQLLARYRNLGKAFYENPATQVLAVEQFRKALQLAPNSSQDRLNYGLALLRAGKLAEGVRELQAVQKQDPALPHTYFNLGIAWKKQGEHAKAIEQFERMVQLVPDEPISHYNLGSLYKLIGKTREALEQFQTASRLDPNLAAAHFQLYNAFRVEGRAEDMRRELAEFQRLKKQQEGAAVPEDVDWSAYAEIYDVASGPPPSGPRAALRFTPQQRWREAASGAVMLELTKNGKASILLWSDGGLRLDGIAVLPGQLTGVRSVAAGDYDNDGLLDLCVVLRDNVVLLRNTGSNFERATIPDLHKSFHQAVWLDYDHDYDLDLMLLGEHSVLLRNQGASGFEDHSADFPFVPGEALSAAPLRVVPDTKGFDLLITYAAKNAVLYRDKLMGKYTAEPTPIPAGAHRPNIVDTNNDGFLDVLFVAGGTLFSVANRNSGLQQPAAIAQDTEEYIVADLENRGILDVVTGRGILRNAVGNFEEAKKPASFGDCIPLDSADLNGDGKSDLVCAHGTFANTTASRNGWIGVELTGVKNMKLAPGAEVEVKAGTLYQKRTYTGRPLLFGTGPELQADTVRITWPNGLIQNETGQAVKKQYAYREAQRLSGSCPIVWSWNGSGFEYITDVLGVAPLGASSGDGRTFPLDHDEYIQIAGDALRPKEGEFEIRLTEELSEVAYFDQLRLLTVDHPAASTVYTNEKFKSPPFPEFRLFAITHPVRPQAARDENGRNVLAGIMSKDNVYADGFRRDTAGRAALHSLEIDFGKGTVPRNDGILILNGWVDWADGSTFLAAAQEGRGGLITPYLQVKDRAGQWQTVIEDMGMPAGKPKSIAVDLAGKFLSASREVRIVTNLCVYWDEIFLSEKTSNLRTQISEAPLRAAGLRFRGFSPAVIDPRRLQPEKFIYNGATPTSMWNPTPGSYTRYGDVSELARAMDDKLIIMGSGDELRLRFRADALPRLPSGWKRDFLLCVDGWAKDRDANTAYSQSTDPLPFHGMSGYPYAPTEHYPDDAPHSEYRRTYNTRRALRLLRPLRSDRTQSQSEVRFSDASE